MHPTPTRRPPVPNKMQAEHVSAEETGDRRPLHVILCAPAYDGWQALADSLGLTLTGLFDALGHQAAQAATSPAGAALDLPKAIPFARTIDVRRRRPPR